MKWNFLMYIKVLNKHICFTAEKEICCIFIHIQRLDISKIHRSEERSNLILQQSNYFSL